MKKLFVLASVFCFALSAEAQRAQPASGGSMSGGSMNSAGSSSGAMTTQTAQTRTPASMPTPQATQATTTTESTDTKATNQIIQVGDCVLAPGSSQVMTVIGVGKNYNCTCSWVDISKVTRQQKCDSRKLVKTTCVNN